MLAPLKEEQQKKSKAYDDAFAHQNQIQQWDSVLHHPTHLSQFINDLNLTVSGDTLFVGGDTYVILPSNGATSVEWDSVRNHPTHLSELKLID